MQMWPDQIAGAMQQHQRHQPPLQRPDRYPRSNSRSLRAGCARARGMPAVMKALGPSRSYSPHPVSTSPKSIRPDSRQPSASLAQQKILRNVFAGQDHRRRVHRNQASRRRRRNSSRPSRNFRGSPSRACRARHPSICPRMNWSQRGSIADEIAERDALHFGDGLADLARARAPCLVLRQAGPRLRAQNAVQPRDDQIRPSVALAFAHDFRHRRCRRARASCDSEARSETN